MLDDDRSYNVRRNLSKLRRWDWGVPDSFVEALGEPHWHAVYNLLQSILSEMPQDECTQALSNALGRGEGEPSSLMERRQLLADELGIQPLKVRDREEIAIKRLADKVLVLIDAHTAMKAERPDGSFVAALLGLQQAISEQTAVLREVNERLKRLED